MNERIIEKIKKCFRLSENNPSQEEAAAAALMAQKLIAQYDIDVADLGDEPFPEEKIEISSESVGTGKAWKYSLAGVIANNFRCKTFNYGNRHIAFYGRSTDSKAAKEVFSYLFNLGDKLAKSKVNQATYFCGSAAGVYNSFCLGFVSGIRSKLEAQSQALMIVTPQDVREQWEIFQADMKKGRKRPSIQIISGIYHEGYQEGRYAADSRSITS